MFAGAALAQQATTGTHSARTSSSHQSLSTAASSSASSSSANRSSALDKGIPAGIKPVVHNVIATMKVASELDLKRVATRSRGTEYNPKRFAAAIMRIRDPKSTCLAFASGKLVITGAKNEIEARKAGRLFLRILQRIFEKNKNAVYKTASVKIQNLVASVDVKFPVRLEGLAYEHDDYSSYEPEIFPGLVYRMMQPRVVLLIFVSGKVVITGAKSREHVNQAFENIYAVLLDHRKR